MSEEIFDVVNQEDAIVGQAPRSTVHAENLLHRAVHVLVFHEDGRLFLQKRSMTKDCFPGTSPSKELPVSESCLNQIKVRPLLLVLTVLDIKFGPEPY